MLSSCLRRSGLTWYDRHVKLLVLGAPGLTRDHWQDDLVDEARRIGWDTEFLRIARHPADQIVQRARGADILLWTYTHNHNPGGDASAMLRRIEDAGTVTVGLHLDLYWGLPSRDQRIGRYPWWTCQYVYTSDGGKRDWSGRGVNHRWCPPAFAERAFGRAAPRGEFRYIFTGAYTYSIHTNHRVRLIMWARRRWKRDFNWYGTSLHSRIYGDALGGAISHAHCVLGDAAPAPYYWSDRVVRTMGRGGVLAHPRVEGMAEQGFDESNVVFFDRYDFDKLGKQLDEMTDARREEMRESALQVVRERHLWRHRLQTIAEEVL